MAKQQHQAAAVLPVQNAQEAVQDPSPLQNPQGIPPVLVITPAPVAGASVAVHLNGVAVLVSAPTLIEAVDATKHLLAGVRPLIPASGYDYG